MAYTTTGTAIQELQSSIVATPTSYKVIRRFQGTRELIQAKLWEFGLGATGGTFSITPTVGPYAELVIELGGDVASGSTAQTSSPISTEWSFDTGNAMVPMTEHPSFLSDFSAMSNPAILAWQDMYDGTVRRADVSSAITAEFDAHPFVWTVYYSKQRGQSGYYRGEATLAVADRYQGSAPWGINTAALNKTYTKVALITGLKDRVNPMPSHIEAKIMDGSWLCDHVSVDATSDGMTIQRQGFRWAPAWDSNFYAAA